MKYIISRQGVQYEIESQMHMEVQYQVKLHE